MRKYCMHFHNYMAFNESNLNDLFLATVRAFPKTTKRQHAIDTINITEVRWTPFRGVKTLFVKGLAQNTENGKEYNPMILFKGMNYHNAKENNAWIEITGSDGKNYIFEQINDKNEVLVRCNCSDFQWRFNYFDHLDSSLYGRVRRKYEALARPGSSNPLELPGMCKHLIKLVRTLGNSGILED